ncbi:TerD family protein [Nocardia coubleae]|uniref:DUF2510 domain-containing protein n=1 Tax=Nocardia coubleae TaxID=356147 RepID=A0A846W630_9NOCA|nr:TerD family protein [Nocardia coubleae]NKX88174.1 DUF2510 domain-containing protein [Nocardia coubleae]
MKLSRGANAEIAASAVDVELRWTSQREVDPQALLLTEAGKIRTNDDFVFYNAARHPSGAVALTASDVGRSVLTVSLDTVEAAVSRVVISGSVDEGSFADIPGLSVTVYDGSNVLLSFDVDGVEAVTAIMLGELYRRNGVWKFRAVGQGWDSGLRGLAEEFGVEVDDPPSEAPTAPVAGKRPHTDNAPGWYPDSSAPDRLRWWNGTAWTDDNHPIIPPNPGLCDRCGREKRIPRFGGQRPCRWCESDVSRFLEGWRSRAWQVLTTCGPRGDAWDQLWIELRFERIHEASGREALRPLAISYLERVVSFAFADNEIDDSEMENFTRTVADLQRAVDLGIARQRVEELRQRMHRGRALTQVRAGELPSVQRQGLHLEVDETVYLDVNAAQVKYLASGPKHTEGRLIGSSKKLRFVSAGAGTELPWAKIVSISAEYGNVIIAASTARGGGTYRVPDPEYVAAVLEGALRVAKRLVLAPGQRDSRSIPPHVKAAVWQRDGGRCCQCSDTHYLEFDHVIPLSRGGATSINNLQILCRKCNLEKGARL